MFCSYSSPSHLQLLHKLISDFHPFQDTFSLMGQAAFSRNSLFIAVLGHRWLSRSLRTTDTAVSPRTARMLRGSVATSDVRNQIHLSLLGCSGGSRRCSTPGCPGDGAGCPTRPSPSRQRLPGSRAARFILWNIPLASPGQLSRPCSLPAPPEPAPCQGWKVLGSR